MKLKFGLFEGLPRNTTTQTEHSSTVKYGIVHANVKHFGVVRMRRSSYIGSPTA